MNEMNTQAREQFDCFICYRRSSGFYMAKVIKEHLEKKGVHCFLDLEESRPGDIVQRISGAMAASSNVLLILTADSLDRCQNPKDWVLQEMELAMQYQKRIIPVLMDDFAWPQIRLPETAEKIRSLNSVVFSTNYFDASMEQLYRFLADSRQDRYGLRHRLQPQTPVSRFFIDAFDSPVPVRSVDIALHAGSFWRRNAYKVELLQFLLENQVPIRVLINSGAVVDHIYPHMRHPLKYYTPTWNNLLEWKELEDRYARTIEVRVMDLPILHRIYQVQYVNGDSRLSVRNYMYGNSSSDEEDWIIPFEKDMTPYSREFEYMWNVLSRPVREVLCTAGQPAVL